MTLPTSIDWIRWLSYLISARRRLVYQVRELWVQSIGAADPSFSIFQFPGCSRFACRYSDSGSSAGDRAC